MEACRGELEKRYYHGRCDRSSHLSGCGKCWCLLLGWSPQDTIETSPRLLTALTHCFFLNEFHVTGLSPKQNQWANHQRCYKILTFSQLAQEAVLNDYRKMMNVRYPDLQQYPRNHRGRGECKDGCLQTLTTNSGSIWSEDLISHPININQIDWHTENWGWCHFLVSHPAFTSPLGLPFLSTTRCQDKQRLLSGTEMIASHIIPVTCEQGRSCSAPPLCLEGLSNQVKAKMAGNSMSVPCVAAILLVAILALEIRKDWKCNKSSESYNSYLPRQERLIWMTLCGFENLQLSNFAFCLRMIRSSYIATPLRHQFCQNISDHGWV